MRLIARIPCRFAGKKYLIGDEIPAEVVENPEAQAKRGVLAVMKDGEDADHANVGSQIGDVSFCIPIHLEDQDYAVSVTESEMTVFTDVLQMGVKTTEEKAKIAEIVSSVDSEDLLILMDAVDGRKVVKDAVKERVDALSKPEESETPPESSETDGDDGEPETPPEE